MKNIIYGLIIGLLFGFSASVIASGKYESSSYDASSRVGYGKYNGTIVPIQVTADGKIITQ